MRALAPMRLDRRNATLIEQAKINISVPTGNLGRTAELADIYHTKDCRVLCQNDPHEQVSAPRCTIS